MARQGRGIRQNKIDTLYVKMKSKTGVTEINLGTYGIVKNLTKKSFEALSLIETSPIACSRYKKKGERRAI